MDAADIYKGGAGNGKERRKARRKDKEEKTLDKRRYRAFTIGAAYIPVVRRVFLPSDVRYNYRIQEIPDISREKLPVQSVPQ